MTTTPLLNDEIGITELFYKVRLLAIETWKERRKIALGALIGGLIGLFFAFGATEEFTAKTRLIPYRSGTGGGAGLSGLAGLAGIRLPSGATDQAISADLYPEVAKSVDFKIAIAETPLKFSSLNRTASAIDYFKTLRKLSAVEVLSSYTLGLPSKVMSSIRHNPPASISELDKAHAIPIYDDEYLEIISQLDERLLVAIDKKTAIITISGKMPDRYAAADLVQKTSDLLTSRIIGYESQKAADQYRFVGEQQKIAMERYKEAQQKLARFVDQNRSLISATAQVERDRMQRDYDLAFEVVQQLSRELEQAEIKKNQDTPIFAVLERVVVPNNPSSPKRLTTIALSCLIGILGAIAIIVITSIKRRTTNPKTTKLATEN